MLIREKSDFCFRLSGSHGKSSRDTVGNAKTCTSVKLGKYGYVFRIGEKIPETYSFDETMMLGKRWYELLRLYGYFWTLENVEIDVIST